MTKHAVRRRTSDNSRSIQPDRIQKDDCRAFLPPEEQYERIFVVTRYNKRKLFDFFKKFSKNVRQTRKKSDYYGRGRTAMHERPPFPE